MPDPRPSRGGIPADARARFAAAEARLYPAAVLDPTSYESALALCALALEDLRDQCRDVESVLARRSTLVTALPARAAAAGLGLGGLDPETVVDAASALRCRELEREAAATAAATRVAAARAAGTEWLVEEPEPAAVMAGVYRRVELHVPTGTMLVSSAEAAGGGDGVTYRLEVVVGDGFGAEEESPRTFSDRDEWLRAAERSRTRIAAHP